MSDYNGSMYMAVAANENRDARVLDLSSLGDEVTIEAATNTKTGESINSTTMHQYTYESTDASALAEEIDRLKELRQAYAEQASAGGGGGSGSGTQPYLIGGIVALAAVLILGRR